MDSLALIGALLVAFTNLVAASWGAWRWWQVESDARFWVALRAIQVVQAAFAVAAGALYIGGFEPDDGLFWLYALLPVAVSYFAEQLRLLSAQTVLDTRGLPDAEAVGALPEAEQTSVVRAILRREMGVMALSAGVICFLALRAAGTI